MFNRRALDGKEDVTKKVYSSVLVLLFFSLIYIIFFSPALLSGQLLAPGDGLIQSVPAFYAARTLWTNLLLSGFPAAADPTIQTWYPLSLLFSLIPNSWNAFVISAYVLSSCFSYGYVYTLTGSKLSAYISGIVFGMSGFLIGHLGHTSMIHTAVWMPLMLWAFENLRRSFSKRWIIIGCFAIVCSVLAGHPQITVYSLGLSIAYILAFGWIGHPNKFKYYKTSLSIILIGVALAAVQIIPTAELMSLGLRSRLTFQDFVSYSLPFNQTLQLLFPYLFGGAPDFYGIPYVGGYGGLTELGGYIGLLPLILALIACLSYSKKSLVRFWCIVAIFSLLLTLGDATPLARLMFHIPAYNKFRVPARHFLEMSMAVSVLAGLGAASIQEQIISRKQLVSVVISSVGVFLAGLLCVFTFLKPIWQQGQKLAIQQNLLPNSILWLNLSIIVPSIIFLFTLIVIFLWHKRLHSKPIQAAVLAILILDLSSFGWFYEWQTASPSVTSLEVPDFVQRYKEILDVNNQRVLPIQGGLASTDEVPPNMSRLWGVSSASGYGPFISSRMSQLLLMSPAGRVFPDQLLASGKSQSFNLMSIRYLLLPSKDISSVVSQGDIWSDENIPVRLGSGCGQEQPRSIKLSTSTAGTAPSISKVNKIGIVSSLECSTDVSDNAKVLEVRLTDGNGKVFTHTLQAGVDTSEWAYDCADVLPSMKHRRATIFESFPIRREGFPNCKGHKYVSLQSINQLESVKTVELNWVSQSGAIDIQKISLISEQNKQSQPVTEISNFLANDQSWRYLEDVGEASVYENLKVMPRVWLVPEAITLDPETILASIKSSKLPDGRAYDPTKLALLEEPLDFKVSKFDSDATAKLVSLNDSSVQIQTTSKSPSFLVLSDIYYPGWKARVDGKLTHIFQTNYVLRGISLPEGDHVVEFTFEPRSFHVGAGISVAALAWLMYLVLKKKDNQSL